jgi:hypothetical protein
MTVLAGGGRGIGDHFERLIRYGEPLEPDVILYQWYINDLEVTTDRPRTRGRIWRRLFFHKILVQTSYFWFYLDYKLDDLLPKPSRSYREYMIERYQGDTAAWQEFARAFRHWARESKRLTPRVLVVLYPPLHDPEAHQYQVLQDQVRELCRKMDIAAVDLLNDLSDLVGKREVVFSTRYDSHPRAAVHHRIAQVVHDELLSRWPELFAPNGERGTIPRSS